MIEEVLEPGLPIIDPHHHLWDWRGIPEHADSTHPLLEVVRHTPKYLLDDFGADARAGHDVRASVYVECGARYRTDGPEELRPVGEVEFAAGLARAATASEPRRVCSGIVGFADLRLGSAVARTLEAEIAAADGRLRGIRQMAAHDPDPGVLGPAGHAPPGLLLDDSFRAGFALLHNLGLAFDAWVLEPQLSDVVDLARTFPEVTIVLDHLGSPLGIASYAGRLPDRFHDWVHGMRRLSACENVRVKVGGLGNPITGAARGAGTSSGTLADRWRPYVLECIEAFGVGRCMFESNFPVDRWCADYVTLWNTYKRITASATSTEKRALYYETAARTYRLTGTLDR